jgi:hypothetical protein
MPRAGASARAQEKVALQSEVMREAEREQREASDRSKRIAEASALALALEEEIAQSDIVLPEEREKQALQDKVMRAKNDAERKRKARSKVAPGEKDITNAASAFRVKRARLVKRAEQGNAEVQFKLGVMHLDDQYRDDVAATPSAKLRRAKERIIDFKVNFHDSLPKQSCAIQRQPQQPFDNSTKESSLVSGLAAVHRFYEDRNMFRATCVCCSELYAPVCVRTVLIEQGGTWYRRLHGRLSWDHTTFTCSAEAVADTKAQYSTSDSLLANLPLAPNGVVREGQNLKVRVWVNVLFAIVCVLE